MNRKVKLNRAVAWARLKCNTPAVSSPQGCNSRHPLAPCPDLHSTVKRALCREMHSSHGYEFARTPFSIPYIRSTKNIKNIGKVFSNLYHPVGFYNYYKRTTFNWTVRKTLTRVNRIALLYSVTVL